jgi:hypothetical protein
MFLCPISSRTVLISAPSLTRRERVPQIMKMEIVDLSILGSVPESQCRQSREAPSAFLSGATNSSSPEIFCGRRSASFAAAFAGL